ncbi:MAG: HEPN domain-containing protein [Syntrophales bacterium]|jgi:hypothetical protein|nr:HEPN domain-containing protein [Syntrophales bacterium]
MLTHNNVIDFLGDSCAFLKSSLPPTEYNWSGHIIERYPNGYQIISSSRPDFNTFFVSLNIKDGIPFLKPYALLLQNDTRYVRLKDKVKGGDSLGHWWHPNSLLINLLSDYLKEVNTIELSTLTANELSNHFLDSLNSETTTYCVFAPLRGLSALPFSIKFEPDLQMRSLSDTEICSIMEDYRQDCWSPDFPGSTCIAELEFSAPVWQGVRDVSEAKQKFENILNSLRILKDTGVISKTIYTRRKHRGSINYGYGGGWSGDPGRHFLPNHACVIEEGEVNDLLRYYRSFTKGNLPGTLKRSLRRLNFAIERDLPEDKLVDSIVALEVLYGDGSGAIGYKIALRASVFLEDEFDARRSINDFINNSYKIRSAVIHGKGSIPPNHPVERLISLSRRSIRKSIDLFIQDNIAFDSNAFDDLLLQ